MQVPVTDRVVCDRSRRRGVGAAPGGSGGGSFQLSLCNTGWHRAAQPDCRVPSGPGVLRTADSGDDLPADRRTDTHLALGPAVPPGHSAQQYSLHCDVCQGQYRQCQYVSYYQNRLMLSSILNIFFEIKFLSLQYFTLYFEITVSVFWSTAYNLVYLYFWNQFVSDALKALKINDTSIPHTKKK